MTIRLILLSCMLLSTGLCIAQTTRVKGNIFTKDTAHLSILSVTPDSFPHITSIFKAETKSGEPLWNLTKDIVQVTEDDRFCEVTELRPLSENKPINIGLVIDHSGSMSQDLSQLFSPSGKFLGSFNYFGEPVLPASYKPPILSAKKAASEFIASFNSKKDKVCIIGFSSEVDHTLALSNDLIRMNNVISDMEAEGTTALYDAMMAGITELKNASGVNILVVLTDGQDNASKSKPNELISLSKQLDIPIYLIGLGDVNKDQLRNIAKQTNGSFFYTKTSDALDKIYKKISHQIQAFYHLTYLSENFSSIDSVRELKIAFELDSFYIAPHSKTINLPPSVKIALANAEERKQTTYLISGAIISVFSVGTVFVLIRRKRSTNTSS